MLLAYLLVLLGLVSGSCAAPLADVASSLSHVTSDLADVAQILQDVSNDLKQVAQSLEEHQPTLPESSTESQASNGTLTDVQPTVGGVERPIFHMRHKTPSVSLNLRIVGGTDSALGEFPYLASIQVPNEWGTDQHLCGGVLISTTDVLTVASCIFSFQDYQLSVSVGVYDLTDPGSSTVTRKVRAMTIHPDFVWEKTSNNIAMLHLAEAVELNEHVSVLEVEKTGPEVGASCSMAGWGVTDAELNSGMGATLFKFPVRVAADGDCVNVFNSINDIAFEYDPPSMVCGVDMNGGQADFCQGDTGGPLVCVPEEGGDEQLGGLASFGVDCAKGDPSVYTEVSHYYSWIVEVKRVQQPSEY